MPDFKGLNSGAQAESSSPGSRLEKDSVTEEDGERAAAALGVVGAAPEAGFVTAAVAEAVVVAGAVDDAVLAEVELFDLLLLLLLLLLWCFFALLLLL